jgi:hypothetical protein
MKKISAFIAIITLSLNSFAQEASSGPEFRKHRFGLKGTPGVSYFSINKPGKSNKGLGYHIGGGLIYENALNKTVVISSGILFSQTTGRVEYSDSLQLAFTRVDNGIESPDTAFQLLSRTYVFNTVDVPIKFKFRTPEIGYMTYFGEFGTTLSLITKSSARNNQVNLAKGSTESKLSGNEASLQAADETNFFRGGINFGGGVEWNVVGNTSLLFGANINLPFTNILKKKSKTISYMNEGAGFTRATSINFIALQVGVLF